jgi:hypothetical protein
MADISIDRLVFEVPGLTAGEAGELAQRVGAGLSKLSIPSAAFGTLTVDLNEQASSHDIPRLANAIVDSLIRQMG